jgi:hypothetical protein
MADWELTVCNKMEGGIAEICAEVLGLGALKDSDLSPDSFAKSNLLR